jgi:hypothetical protein
MFRKNRVFFSRENIVILVKYIFRGLTIQYFRNSLCVRRMQARFLTPCNLVGAGQLRWHLLLPSP